jgi:hypothetical protein
MHLPRDVPDAAMWLCATAIMDGSPVNALEAKFDSGSGHCDYTESLLPLLRGVLEMRAGGGVRNVSPASLNGRGRGFTSVHENILPSTTSLPFSTSISIISFVLENTNLIESGCLVLGDRCNYTNTKYVERKGK